MHNALVFLIMCTDITGNKNHCFLMLAKLFVVDLVYSTKPCYSFILFSL